MTARSYSREFAQEEWDGVFTRTWQIGGMAYQLEKPGSTVTHETGNESILVTRDDDGTIRAFYNVCPHRGNRRVAHEERCGTKRMVCAYHSWAFSLDGVVRHVRDAEDYPQGSPIGKVKLEEIRCEVLGGLVWFNMDPNARPLRESLGAIMRQWGLDPAAFEGRVREARRAMQQQKRARAAERGHWQYEKLSETSSPTTTTSPCSRTSR